MEQGMGKGFLGRSISCVQEVLAACSRAAQLIAALRGNAGHREKRVCSGLGFTAIWLNQKMLVKCKSP